jgi:flagellar biosynthetic protein FlhB/type III secretion protein U
MLDAERPLAALRGLLLPVLLAAAAVAAAQWGLARVAFERRLRMTPEEFKEEMRSLEADPRIKLERHRK